MEIKRRKVRGTRDGWSSKQVSYWHVEYCGGSYDGSFGKVSIKDEGGVNNWA